MRKTADIKRRQHWFPREMTSGERKQKFHTDDALLDNSSDCGLKQISHAARPIIRTSGLVTQTLCRGETSDGVAKCRLLSRANQKAVRVHITYLSERVYQFYRSWEVAVKLRYETNFLLRQTDYLQVL